MANLYAKSSLQMDLLRADMQSLFASAESHERGETLQENMWKLFFQRFILVPLEGEKEMCSCSIKIIFYNLKQMEPIHLLA